MRYLTPHTQARPFTPRKVDTKKVRMQSIVLTHTHIDHQSLTQPVSNERKGVVKDVNLDRTATVKVWWTFAQECRQIPDSERKSRIAIDRENDRTISNLLSPGFLDLLTLKS